MNRIDKILCVVDPIADSQPAIQRAAWLALSVDAQLELFFCIDDEYRGRKTALDPASVLLTRNEFVEQQEEQLEGLAEPLRAQGISVNTRVLWDRPLFEGVVRHAIASGADVVFKDTHHHSMLKRTLLSNTDWNLIRTCPIPLWLVKSHVVQETPVFLAAIDPGQENDKPALLDDELLAYGTALSKATDAELHAFHAYDPSAIFASVGASGYVPLALPYDEIERDMRERHAQSFDEVADNYEISNEHKHLMRGATHEELVTIANELPVDVVIMGAVGRNYWKHLLIGATAERTLEALPCDLLIIKPTDFKSAIESSVDEIAA